MVPEGDGPLSFVPDVVRSRSHPGDLDLQARWFLLRPKCRALAPYVTGERLDPGLVGRGVRSADPTQSGGQSDGL